MLDQTLIHFLNQHQLPFKIHEHEPIFTVEQGLHLHEIIPGPHCKSLFLKDHKKNFILVSLREEKRVDLKALSLLLNKGRLSFGKPEELLAMLKLTPGSVTPYGLLFDESHKVSFFLDEDLVECEITNFHPMRNDMTLSMLINSFLQFFTLIEHSPTIVKIPTI
ncbi:MAG TPA: prolyl-tRNA synthetase associated domain-containing protein [Candidatus Berkiella sp.]|nr:prolyl-tRNA synthetase associated domain-containing protein [Candidatus Berkiella sp.]